MKNYFGVAITSLAIAVLSIQSGQAQQAVPSTGTLPLPDRTTSAKGLCGTGVSPAAGSDSDAGSIVGLVSRVESSRLISSSRVPGVSTEAAKLLPLGGVGFVYPDLSSTRSSHIVESSHGSGNAIATASRKPDKLKQLQYIKFYVGASPLCYLNLTPSSGIAANYRFRVFDDRSDQELGISVFAKEQGAVTIAFAQPIRPGTTIRIEKRGLDSFRKPIATQPEPVQYALSGGQADFTEDIFYGTAQFKRITPVAK